MAFSMKPITTNFQQNRQSFIQQIRSFSPSIKPRYLKHKSIHEVVVSNVDDGPLIFNIQLESCIGDVENLMSNLKYFPRTPLSVPLFIGDACIALHSKTEQLRRAIVSKVINIREAELYYCDFGDREILQHSSIYEIPSRFLNPQALSLTFTLGVTHKLIITQEMKDYFEQLVLGKTLTLVVMEPKSPLMHYGDLIIENKSVSKFLLEGICLPRGTLENVHVSYTLNCHKFFVHLDKKIPDLEFLCCHLYNCNKQPIPIDVRHIKPGLKCLAYSKIGSQWFRAEVLSLADNRVTIHYIDYGNDETLLYSDIRSICCDEISKIPNQAVQCILSGFESEPDNSELQGKFEYYIRDKSLMMSVLDVKPSGIVVDLYEFDIEPNFNVSEKVKNVTLEVSGQNYTDNSEQNFYKTSLRAEFTSPVLITPPIIPSGVKKYCEIVFITSPSDFYVQLIPDNSEFNAVMDRIAQIYESGGNNLSRSNVKVGTSCVAQYSVDLNWYRAVIESVNRDKVTVRFVDYGNVETVTFDQIKEIDAELAKLSIQAIHCKLFRASKTTWNNNEVDEFRSCTRMKSFEIKFIIKTDDVHEVLLRQLVNNEAVGPYLNDLFSRRVD